MGNKFLTTLFNLINFIYFRFIIFPTCPHKTSCPKKLDIANIAIYKIKSVELLTKVNIHITPIIFTNVFLVTVFLNSSNPIKSQEISIAADII
ncbi:hypothetical protein D3C81_1962080 [compost metagenome]